MRPLPRTACCFALWLAACADTDGTAADGTETSTSGDTTASTLPNPTTSATTTAPTTTGATDSATTSTTSVDDTSSEDTSATPDLGGVLPEVLCGSTPPDGAEVPPPLPTYSGEMCPPVVPGWNTFASSGSAREFLFVAPTDARPDEVFPIVFLWHWLGGSAEDFFEEADVQTAADQMRFIAAIPAEKGDLVFRWPFSAVDSDARMQEEFVFFDDMLACIAESYPIDNNCVSSTGVSAGALFTSQLGWGRGEYLSSIIVLSGGIGGVVKGWNGSPHIMPAMVLWGGPDDFCVAINFEQTSHDLENALIEDGHPILECVHNCGHSEPPFEPPFDGATPYLGMWRFWLDHPYWLADGETTWADGVPDTTPMWCSMGAGTATPREGECTGAGC